jgi:sulfur-oxidizing protein SoxY
VVPVEVVSNIPNSVQSRPVAEGPLPLATSFDFANGALPEVQVRVRLASTTMVQAVVKTADGKFYTAQKEVKVTVGGCGG